MSEYGRRSSRFPQAGSSMFQSSLRPSGFLNKLNPMSRTYQGYMQANQSLLEEDEEAEEEDVQGHDGPGFRMHEEHRASWGDSSRTPGTHKQADDGDREPSDDEVPQSFMIENPVKKTPVIQVRHSKGKGKSSSRKSKSKSNLLPLNVDDSASIKLPPRPSEIDSPVQETRSYSSPRPSFGLDAKQLALWKWVNVYDLDLFLQDVYRYYEGKGIYCIALARGLHLLTVGFVIFFSSFLLNCIDYGRIKPEGVTRLSDVVVSKCFSRFSGAAFMFYLLFGTYYLAQVASFVFEVIRLLDMYRFYTYLLGIPDADIQTISWPEIVRRIEAIREDNPRTAQSSASHGNPSSSMTAKLDAHDIANRIMREENYLIAVFNKDLLDLRVPLPAFLKSTLNLETNNGMTLTTALEYNLRICLMYFLFDRRGRVREAFLHSKNRAKLTEELRHRFVFMGVLNAVLAPVIIPYLAMYYFFRYFEEYHNNPSTIGSRNYTLYARWKFREFNELPHLFRRRLDESYPTAKMYIGQFPNEKIALIMRFVYFIAGALAAVLVLASVIEPELVTNFEITPHRTVLFYLTVFTGILATARGMIPEENFVFDPEVLMMDVIHYTHYMPTEWKGELHSQRVHKQFGELFDMKIMIFARELLSVVLTPFILCFSLPNCAPALVDFFREFTVHVDSLGHVCSFAVFDFKRHGNVHFGAPTRVKEERLMSKEGKMEKSFLNFKAAHPEWQPTDPSGSLYLSKMADFNSARNAMRRRLPEATSAMVIAERRLAERAAQHEISMRAAAGQHGGSAGGLSRRNTGLGGGKAGLPMADSMLSGPSSPLNKAKAIPSIDDSVKAIEESAINPFPGPPPEAQDIHPDDLVEDGGVGSALGESYVDGKVARGSKLSATSQQHESDRLEDGGMLGLLAQVYGGRGGGFGGGRML